MSGNIIIFDWICILDLLLETDAIMNNTENNLSFRHILCTIRSFVISCFTNDENDIDKNFKVIFFFLENNTLFNTFLSFLFLIHIFC